MYTHTKYGWNSWHARQSNQPNLAPVLLRECDIESARVFTSELGRSHPHIQQWNTSHGLTHNLVFVEYLVCLEWHYSDSGPLFPTSHGTHRWSPRVISTVSAITGPVSARKSCAGCELIVKTRHEVRSRRHVQRQRKQKRNLAFMCHPQSNRVSSETTKYVTHPPPFLHTALLNQTERWWPKSHASRTS